MVSAEVKGSVDGFCKIKGCGDPSEPNCRWDYDLMVTNIPSTITYVKFFGVFFTPDPFGNVTVPGQGTSAGCDGTVTISVRFFDAAGVKVGKGELLFQCLNCLAAEQPPPPPGS